MERSQCVSVESTRVEVEKAITALAEGGVDHVLSWYAIRRGSNGAGVTGSLDIAIDRLIEETRAEMPCYLADNNNEWENCFQMFGKAFCPSCCAKARTAAAYYYGKAGDSVEELAERIAFSKPWGGR